MGQQILIDVKVRLCKLERYVLGGKQVGRLVALLCFCIWIRSRPLSARFYRLIPALEMLAIAVAASNISFSP